MEFTAKQIAQFVQGTVEGDENAIVNTFSKIEEGKKGAITFLSNPKYTHYIYETEASVVLVDQDLQLERQTRATLIRVKNAYECVARLLQMYDSMKPKKTGIHPLAFISPTAKVGDNCYVGPFAYIGDFVTIGNDCQVYPHATIGENVILGNNCLIYSNVSIYHDCKLGNNVTIHSGSVIGADGFGFAPAAEGYDKIPQIGIVTIEDNVEIGANTCIDRATMGSTYVHKGVKLDNLIQIAHNVEVGANTVIASQTGIAGSAKVGEWCMFGGQVGVAGHITVAPQTQVGAQAGIISGIKKPGQVIIGSPAWDAKGFMKSAAMFRRLPEIAQQLNALQKEIEKLQQNQES